MSTRTWPGKSTGRPALYSATTLMQPRWWSARQWRLAAAVSVFAFLIIGEVGQTLPPESAGRVYPASVDAGRVTVRGYAFAGDDRGIARVDVSIDGGRSWVQAELEESLGPWAWRFWHLQLDLVPGDSEIVARAWDTSAAAQPEHAEHLWNPKGYVNNAWARITVHVVAVDNARR